MYQLTQQTNIILGPKGYIIEGGNGWEEYQAWLSEVDADGSPINQPTPAETEQEKIDRLKNELLSERHLKIEALAWMIQRHQTQEPLGGTTLTPEQYTELLRYIQDIRDMGANHKQLSGLENPTWPAKPAWL